MPSEAGSIRKGVWEFVIVACPKVLSGVCTLLLNLALLRYFGPAEFGLYSLCAAIILLTDSVIGTGVDMAVLRLAPLCRERDPIRSLGYQKTALRMKFLLGLGCALLVAILSRPLSRALFHQPDLQRLLYITCIASTAVLLLRSAQVHPQVACRFQLFSLLEFLQLATKFGGIALLMLSGHVSVPAVLVFFVLGPLVAFLVWRFTAGREFGRASANWHFAGEIWHYSRWFLLTFGLAAIISRMDLFLLTRRADLTQVGLFSAGQVVAWVPILVGSYVAVLLTPRIMPLLREGRFHHFFHKFQLILLTVCGLLFVAGIWLIPVIGPKFFPPSFARSVEVILVLLPGSLAGLATFPLTMSFVMFVRPKFLFTVDCVSLPLLVALYLYAIPRYGAIGAAIVTTAANVTRAAIAQIMAWRWAGQLSHQQISFDMSLSAAPIPAVEVGS